MPDSRITSDELASWREHPVSMWVFAAMQNHAAAQRDAWIEASWDNGNAERDLLIELRARADTFQAIFDSEYTDFCAALGETPLGKGA